MQKHKTGFVWQIDAGPKDEQKGPFRSQQRTKPHIEGRTHQGRQLRPGLEGSPWRKYGRMCNCNARNTSSEKTDEKHGATGKRKQSEANETDNQISQHFAYPGVRKRKLPEIIQTWDVTLGTKVTRLFRPPVKKARPVRRRWYTHASSSRSVT